MFDGRDEGVSHSERSDGQTLDAVDLEIIAALREDGRTAFADIARRLGVSPGMIRMRYQRLVREGIVKVTAITNPARTGRGLMAHIGLKVDLARVREVADAVAGLPEVVYLAVLAGSHDLLAEVHCEDNRHLLAFLSDKLHAVEGVKDSETLIILDIVKEIYY